MLGWRPRDRRNRPGVPTYPIYRLGVGSAESRYVSSLQDPAQGRQGASLLEAWGPREVSLMCDSLVAVGSATADGSLVFGKNSDRPAAEEQCPIYSPARRHPAGACVRCPYIEIPEAAETLAVLFSLSFPRTSSERGWAKFVLQIKPAWSLPVAEITTDVRSCRHASVVPADWYRIGAKDDSRTVPRYRTPWQSED